MLADRDTAGGYEHVRLETPCDRRRGAPALRRRRDASRSTCARDREQGRLEHGAVRLVDLTRPEALARGGRSSLPVVRTATRGRRPRSRRRRPTAARAPSWAGPSRSPASRTVSPARTSPPRGRTFAPTTTSDGTSTSVAMIANTLDRDDRVGAFRDGTARRDRHRLTRPERGDPRASRRRHATTTGSAPAHLPRGRRIRPWPSSANGGRSVRAVAAARRARCRPRRAAARRSASPAAVRARGRVRAPRRP